MAKSGLRSAPMASRMWFMSAAHLLARLDLLPDPVSQRMLTQRACREAEHRIDRFHLIGAQSPAIDGREATHRKEGGALVAIDAGVILCNAKPVGRRERCQINRFVIQP